MANATSLDLSTETSGDATVVIPVGRIDGSTASPFWSSAWGASTATASARTA